MLDVALEIGRNIVAAIFIVVLIGGLVLASLHMEGAIEEHIIDE